MSLEPLPLRLVPDDDLRRALEEAVARKKSRAAFVVSGIGSLGSAHLRFAGADKIEILSGDLEVLTIAGTISPEGAHLHISISDAQGRVFGGHVAYGCVVRTTAEVLLVLLPEWSFGRERDEATGFAELVTRKAAPEK